MNSGISYPIILVSTALCVKTKATIIGRYINSSIHYVWAIKYKLELSLYIEYSNCLGLHSKFFDINLVVLKAILVVASSTWNNAHKCKWQNTKFTCFVFFLFYKKFINQAIQKSLSLSFHDFAHTQLLSNSMSLFSIFLQRFNWMVF